MANERHSHNDGRTRSAEQWVVIGLLFRWPTPVTLVMFPILVFMYVRLAQREEQDRTPATLDLAPPPQVLDAVVLVPYGEPASRTET